MQSSHTTMVRRHNVHTTRESWQSSQQVMVPHDGDYPLAMRPAQPHDRPLTVTQALREYADIPVRSFALIAILDNGQERLYSSGGGVQLDPHPIWQALRRDMMKNNSECISSPEIDSGMWTANSFTHNGPFIARHPSSERRLRRQERPPKPEESDNDDDDDDSMSSTRRKRQRPSGLSRNKTSNAPIPSVTSNRMQTIRIGDSEEVLKFYAKCFRDLQQTACKSIGKVFVKAVEPKKQTNHPYVKGDKCSPPWWPSGDDFVRHKEPDHLLKNERVKLLVWILRLVVQPNARQHASIQHLNLTVKKLEDLTTEKLNEFFNDSQHVANAGKRKYMKELFRIAKQEERYLDGGIDADTHCTIMLGSNRRDEEYVSSEEEGNDSGQSDDEDSGKPNASADTGVNDETTVPHISNPQSEARSSEMFPSTDHRSHAIPFGGQPQTEQSHFSEPSVFSRGLPIGFQAALANDHDHRAFGSPVYPQSQSPYSWTTSTAAMVSTPTIVSPFYTSTNPLPGPSNPSFQLSQMPPLAQNPPLLPSLNSHPAYDPQSRYDLPSGMVQQVRSGNLSQTHMHHHNPAYSEYPEAVDIGHPDNEYKEAHIHHSQH